MDIQFNGKTTSLTEFGVKKLIESIDAMAEDNDEKVRKVYADHIKNLLGLEHHTYLSSPFSIATKIGYL